MTKKSISSVFVNLYQGQGTPDYTNILKPQSLVPVENIWKLPTLNLMQNVTYFFQAFPDVSPINCVTLDTLLLTWVTRVTLQLEI